MNNERMDYSAHSAEMRARLEMVFGSCCTVPEIRGGSGMLEVTTNAKVFEKLLQHWRELPESSRPHLRGITLARLGGRTLQLIIDAGSRSPFLLLSVDWSGGRPIPSLVGIWAYASWWEDELRTFEKVEIESQSEKKGIVWRRN